MFKQSALPRTLRATRAAATQSRGLATVADPPVRHYGGLKDQDRIFQNLLRTGDPVSGGA
jgi:NADH dehydrogenase (ubiquinone) flavoprotein 1